jgi:SAM-dependent methyltransferase
VLDPQTYRASEQLAKSLTPSWRISQIHNVDHFERAGFPVRIGSVRELGQIIDTMQENRFDKYLAELGGLSKDEYALILDVCVDAVLFQLSYLPHRQPVLPISTLLSAFALYKKMQGAKPGFRTVLEIGPGCGYLSFFLKRYESLGNYSQIEACESFYILQNLVNLSCFGARCDERALPPENVQGLDYFVNPRPDMEFSPVMQTGGLTPLCTHYPWWRIGEIVSRDRSFDIVTSNANLLEFNAPALDDYLSLMHRALKPDGLFLVQCTGFAAGGTVDHLLDRIYEKGFAPLMFVRELMPAQFTGGGRQSGLIERLTESGRDPVSFTTNNALFVKTGHPLFQKHYDRKNYHQHFISQEAVVKAAFFDRPPQRDMYTVAQFAADTEERLKKILHA